MKFVTEKKMCIYCKCRLWQ